MGDYKEAHKYYKRFIDLRDAYKMDIYRHESLRIAYTLLQLGQKEKAEEFAKTFKQYADNDHSIYKHLLLSGYYVYRDDIKKAVEHLRIFSKEDDFLYWVLIFKDDPLTARIKDLPEVKEIMSGLEKKFWKRHEKMKERLEEEGLL
jgi:tetratricopeptide (TPR) repeat protein